MADQGGWLDEVLWIVNTDNEDDLRYLDEILAKAPPRHRKLRIPGDKLYTNTYYKAWQHLERGKYYVKIDDDIVWFDDNAIPQLVSRKISHPDDFVVSANLPELSKPAKYPKSWKPSQHGFWHGPDDFTWTLDLNPPYDGHRWLRVQDEKMMIQTPVNKLKYEVWGDSYTSWAIATQTHYSLLENIEKDALDLYRFNPPWLMHGQRIRINFMCVYADDILDTDIRNWPRDRGDEDMIVLDLPKQLRRPVVIVGTALAAHLQYTDQPGIAATDVLTRYQRLAEDKACLEIIFS
ncbi:hypothetical protein CEP52_017070 [Fusarium oligoseptatum]|uniref:Uncharacterized protein n=1 Tax=Fusarium oligoseptatum TaxID=2604345 RepID=A0A428RWS0_9HYPO|nr:hypothetical protein CEP52_017070 [Fusarium oligoseptatum]